MPIKCRQCDQAELERGVVQLSGKVRGEEYTVEMLGLKCPRCKYQTVDGPDMPEYGRLLADRYRSSHGLLTSDEIRTRRERLGMSQQAFADFLGVGIASVKRWEMGKIQDARSNALIVERTAHSTENVQTYMIDSVALGSTMKLFGNLSAGVTILSTASVELGSVSHMEKYFNNVSSEPLYFCGHCKQTAWASVFLNLPNHQTFPPHIAEFLNRKKERRSYARSR